MVCREPRNKRTASMTVEIDHKGTKGQVKIHYKSLEQLDEIMRRLNTFVEVD